MKRPLPLFLFCIILLVVVSVSPPAQSRERRVLITTGEYPPWASEGLPHGGFVTRVISEAFRRKNITPNFQYYPWERAYKLAQNGVHHATSFWADTEETREKHAEFFFKSDPVMHARVVFFQLKERPMQPWKELTDLNRYRIAGMIGETSTQILRQNGLNVHQVAKADQAFMMILFNRLDIFPLELLTGLDILRFQFGPDQAARFSYDARSLFETPASLLFSKAHPEGEELAARFNEGLREMQHDGTYAQFYQELIALQEPAAE